MKSLCLKLAQDESGQDLVEYALLAALVSVVSVLGLQTLGPSIFGIYDRIGIFFASL